MRLSSEDKHHMKISADRKAQISRVSGTSAFLICAFRSADFLRWCLSPKRNITHHLFCYFQYFLVLILRFFNPFTAMGYFQKQPPRWPTFLAMFFSDSEGSDGSFIVRETRSAIPHDHKSNVTRHTMAPKLRPKSFARFENEGAWRCHRLVFPLLRN